MSSRKQGPGETVSGPARAPVLDLLGRFLSTEVFLPQPQGGLDGGRELSCLLPGSFAPAHPGVYSDSFLCVKLRIPE